MRFASRPPQLRRMMASRFFRSATKCDCPGLPRSLSPRRECLTDTVADRPHENAMSDKPNFVLVTTEPEAEPEPQSRARIGPPPPSLVERAKAWAVALLSPGGPHALATTDTPHRPRLVFGFDATASREPAWAMARTVTDALVRALPGELDVALAVHGGGLLHTFTGFTSDANALRDRAAGIRCMAGQTRLLAILARCLREPGVRVVTYIGDVYEESRSRGQKLADELGARGVKLIVLHDTSDWAARRDAEGFLDLAG